MAESVRINGVVYADVPQVEIPKSDGQGDAVFFLTDGDNVAAGDILSGKTAHGAAGAVTGTMPNNGDVSGDIATKAGTVTVPSGYTTGGTVAIDATEQAKIISDNIKNGVTVLGVSGKSTVVDTEIASDAAAAATILNGKKAYVNGTEITGTMTAATVAQDSSTKVLTIS